MIYIRSVISICYCVYFVCFYMNLPMFQWILSAKGRLPFHPSTEEGANERTCDSYGDILLVDSCTLPLAVCLEIFTPLLPGCILSLKSVRLTSSTDSKHNAI